MKLSTAIIAGVALASAAASANAAGLATVYEQYGYGNGGFDGVGAYVTANTALADVTVAGVDYGALVAGASTNNTFIGDVEYGFNPNYLVSITTVGGQTFSGSFADVIGDADDFGSAVQVGSLGVPEPAAWALMLVGFAGIGGAVRASRKSALTA